MAKQHMSTDTDTTQPDAGAADAEWHPYRVWQATVRQPLEAPASPTDTDATGSWKPLAVWRRQIKGD